ncbi:MAG TPA: ABC transporter ATP-binding protein [Burkholderiales bacterium]|nr:ABC transporter ATP-binding protein [Burkholderiales bacterium]
MLAVVLHQKRPITLDVDLRCDQGELLALVGPSGSGKSTVLKIIAGLLRGDVGSVRIDGETWFDSEKKINVPVHERSVGYVFQSYALFPHMTVLENLMAAGGSEARARHWIEAVRMKGLEHQRPHQLSGGQQQRAALARALVREPKLLLLDEPFSAVDQLTRDRLYEELAELRRRLNIPVIFVTHSLTEAQLLADRMVVLHRGRTLQSGTPEEVFRAPATPDIARLVAHKNLLEAQVIAADQTLTLLDWRGLRLNAPPGAFTSGEKVAWLIPALDVRMNGPDEAPAHVDNRFEAQIESVVPLGDQATVRIRMPNGECLTLSAAAHIVRKRQLAAGRSIGVSLLPASIHLMPHEPH